jgi:hypothetical protein
MGSSSGHSSSNIWDGSSVSDCIYASSINYRFTTYKAESDVISGSSTPYVTYIDYQVLKDIDGSDVAHELEVTYADLIMHPCDP